MGIIDSSAHPTLVHVLRQRATEHPDKVAFEYLGQRSETNASDRELSYGSLDGKARAIAARLVEAGGQNEPVMLLFRPGLDFISAFLGCLYARAFAVSAYPPAGGSGRGLVRLQAVLSDCGARIVLTGRRGVLARERARARLTFVDPNRRLACDSGRQPSRSRSRRFGVLAIHVGGDG